MANEMWSVYGITEDEYIECCRCSEKLENLGVEFDKKLLNCDSCALCGRCTVARENMFLGARPVSSLKQRPECFVNGFGSCYG